MNLNIEAGSLLEEKMMETYIAFSSDYSDEVYLYMIKKSDKYGGILLGNYANIITRDVVMKEILASDDPILAPFMR